jgi:hypothetical protein
MSNTKPKTSYFTFGQNHAHGVAGFTYDKDIVVQIVSPDPRASMFEIFGNKWASQYDKVPDMSYYSRGIKILYHTPIKRED